MVVSSMGSMPVKQFEARVHHRPGAAVIVLSGTIESSAHEVLNAAYDEVHDTNPSMVVLDFARVNFINSTGVALIVGVLAKARTDERRVRVCGLSDHDLEIFTITRLTDFVEIFPDQASALAGVEGE